jgi:hypothetical protein
MTKNSPLPPELRWQRGNDALLRLIVTEVQPPTEENAEPTVLPFDLSQVDDLAVKVFVGTQGRVVPVKAEQAEGETGVLVLPLPATLPSATYGIELTCRKNGKRVRTAFAAAFAVVEAQHEATVTLERIDGPLPDFPAEEEETGETEARQEPQTVEAELALSIQYVTQATVRGKNAYELWLEAGNEGTLEDYLNGFYRPSVATASKDGLMSAADKQWLDQVGNIEVMTADEVGDLVHSILNN